METTTPPEGNPAWAGSSQAQQDSTQNVNVLQQKVETLTKQAEITARDFSNLEKRMDRSSNFMMSLTGVIAVLVFGGFMLIASDYYKNTEERNDKFVQQTLQDQMASQQLVDTKIQDFKNCIFYNGLSHCLR